MRLSSLADLARSLDASSFVVRLPDPVLVAGDGFGSLERGASFDTPDRGLHKLVTGQR